jgi:guanine nucleotide-binding protein alpha-1 subunit
MLFDPFSLLGKSTTLKSQLFDCSRGTALTSCRFSNYELTKGTAHISCLCTLSHFSQAFRAELPSWRAVIQLNILRSVRVVIETLNEAHSHQVSPSDPYLRFPPQTSHHLQLRARLSPLLQVEESLTRKLTLESGIRGEAVDSAPNPLTNASFNTRKELSVHSRSSWKSSFKKYKGIASDREEDLIDWDDPADPGKIIYACRDDMIELWNDTIVMSILKMAKVRMEEHGGL